MIEYLCSRDEEEVLLLMERWLPLVWKHKDFKEVLGDRQYCSPNTVADCVVHSVCVCSSKLHYVCIKANIDFCMCSRPQSASEHTSSIDWHFSLQWPAVNRDS